MPFKRSVAQLAAALLLLAAPHFIGSAAAQAPTGGAGSVTIFAAASLRNALDDASAAYGARTGTTFRISYASSLTLARQIEHGAPADLFASADIASMDYLDEKGLLAPGTRVDLLGNSLVIVAPVSASIWALPITKDALAHAVGTAHVATGDPVSVPAGKYAKAALTSLGLWSDLEPHLAFAENVRSALAFVARNEAVLGIVYATDAAAEPRVKVVATFPADSHPPIVYPFAVTKDAKGDAAARFLAWLQTPEARPYFTKQGFTLKNGISHKP